MELQQNLNLMTGILKQAVKLQHICKEDFILDIKGKQCIHFSDFWSYHNITLNQRHMITPLLFFLQLDDFGRCDKLMKADNEVHLLKRFFVQQRLRPQRSNTIMQTAVSEPVD